ncbi:MAG: hypothetical protein J6A23_09280, partial [Thermoguttaceae bacterium]|nr:hypothetical protein [Thermoguttaceae bacterium]
VRLHENGLARIETTPEWFPFLTCPEIREEMLAEFRKAGFTWGGEITFPLRRNPTTARFT